MGNELLKKYLDDNNETQSAFAVRAGVSGGSLSGWLSGKTAPDIYSAGKIEDATAGAVPVRSWERPDGRRHQDEITKTAS